MSAPDRLQTYELLRRSAAGDPRSRQELTGVVKRRLSAESGRLERDQDAAPIERVGSAGSGSAGSGSAGSGSAGSGSAGIDLVAAAEGLSRDIFHDPAADELRAELLGGIARAIEELLGTTGAQTSAFAPAILLPPLEPGAERLKVSSPELGDALRRMGQLQGKDALLAILCLVLDQSVDEAARAIQRPVGLAELEWTVAREWLDRELDLSTRSAGA